MFVGERMAKPVITVPPELPISEALVLMKREHIRRLPVAKDGKLIGIVSDKDLLNASPSSATSLSIWEIHYLLSKITVEGVMTRNVLTVAEDTPIEQAARIMADNKIGGLPVMREGNIVGIITETDLFKILLELMGARETGIRVMVQVPEEPGELARITGAITAAGGDFIALGVYSGLDSAHASVTFKVRHLNLDQVKAAITPVVTKVVDIRSS